MLEKIVDNFSNWYKPEKLEPEDILALKYLFTLNSFTKAYGRSHDMQDYDYTYANKNYGKYFSRKIMLINMLSMLCYVRKNAGEDNQKIKESIRDDELEPPATRIRAVKALISLDYQNIAKYIYNTAIKEQIFELDMNRQKQIDFYANKGTFNIKDFKGYNPIFSNSEKTSIKNFILGKISSPKNTKTKEIEEDFFERADVISEIIHILNIIFTCFNSDNISVLKEIRDSDTFTGKDKIAAIELIEKITNEAIIINQYKPKETDSKKIELTIQGTDIDWDLLETKAADKTNVYDEDAEEGDDL